MEVEENATILEAARKLGVYIPTICYHPDLPPPNAIKSIEAVYRGDQKIVNESSGKEFEGCKLCLVQVEGQEELFLACCTPVSEGMKIFTETKQVQEARKAQLMKILAKHPHACLICAQKEGCTTEPCSTNVPVEERCCPKFGNCELERVAEYIGIREDTPRYTPQNLPIIKNDPLFLQDYNLCIGCTRCVRACQELRGVGALGFVYKNGEVSVGTVAPTLMDSDCRFCGACVEVCPTGALRDKELKAAKREVDLVPCKYACPAEVDIPRYIRLISEGKFAEAAAVIREKLPLPNVLAHACSRPCESACRRQELNEAVSICGLKRFAMERDGGLWKQKLGVVKPTGKKVAIVGSGPAGLSAAYYLARLGYSVTIFEAMPEPGGMLRYGIQEYRLSKKVVEKDIDEIVKLGIEIKTSVFVGKDLTIENLRENYDAVLVAVGLQTGKTLKIEGAMCKGVFMGVDFLRNVSLGKPVKLGRKVLVIGGGNVALDAARTALRLGATEVHILYRRSKEEMPASKMEIEQAEEEGVKISFLTVPKRIVSESGRVKAVQCLRTRLAEPDESGRRKPIPIEGSEFTLKADAIIIAIGQSLDSSWIKKESLKVSEYGTLIVNGLMETTLPKVFACGDAVNGPTSIIEAVASGRKAAFAIDKYLGGSGMLEDKFVKVKKPNPWLGKIEKFAYKRRVRMPSLPVEKRKTNFVEVELGYDEKTAREEASRCLMCDLRLYIQHTPRPPERWLPLKKENVEAVPETEGVYQLLNENKEVIYIKGVVNLKRELEQQLSTNAKAKYFVYEEAKMYTMRESELLQQYIKRNGRMPEQNVEIEEDLY